MLTVIIAEKHIIEQYKQNKALLAPFDKGETHFCELYSEAGSIEKMLPGLSDIVSFNANWRAVIVTDNNKEFINPFDYVQYSKYINNEGTLDFDSCFVKKCLNMFECYECSIKNPLTRLSVALCEAPYFAEIIDGDIYALLESEETLLRFIFKTQLELENTRKIAAKIKRFLYEQLVSFVSKERVDDFLTAIADKDYTTIFSILPAKKIISFLEFAQIGNSATYDPGYWYAIIENTKKAQLYKKLKSECNLKTTLPKEVLCLALRLCDTHVHNSKVVWSDNSETEYTDFVRYNLYNENIRFLVYNILDDYEKSKPSEILRFHILLQILAVHGNSSFSIKKNKLFIVDVEYDKRELSRTIAKIIVRLKTTAAQINEEIAVLRSQKVPELDNRTARLLFETDVVVPIQVDKEYDKKNLMAQYEIGLSRNCPREETPYWDNQYHTITKLFKRFLREPRRAIKKACVEDFKDSNTVSDLRRVISLNENQKDDILIKLEEEEYNMVSTTTSAVYNIDKYNEAIEQADKNIRRGIGQRMSRKKSIFTGLVAVLAYFIGFWPLIFSNLNTIKSFSFSWLITGIVVTLFAVSGLIFLFILKRRQVNRYKHFNYVMSGICSEIEDSLENFSKYLSHACMVMREKSVLNTTENKVTEDVTKIRILKYNLVKLEQEIEKNYKLLTNFSDEDEEKLLSREEISCMLPFDYDYTEQGVFDYSFFDCKETKEIEYMLKGHNVQVPMICVEKVTITREELYD